MEYMKPGIIIIIINYDPQQTAQPLFSNQCDSFTIFFESSRFKYQPHCPYEFTR